MVGALRAEGRPRRERPFRICVSVGVLRRELALKLDLAGCVRVVDNLNWHTPDERLDQASAGVVFAAIEECELDAKLSLSWLQGPKGNSQGKLQIL